MPVEKLFEPFAFGNFKMRNRTIMAPMTRRRSPGGVPNQSVADYYLRRAKGGVGAIMTEGLAIAHPTSVYNPDIPNLFTDEAISAWTSIVKNIQQAGAAIIPQLWHVGGFRATVDNPPNAEIPSTSPSGMYMPGIAYGKPATQKDIEDVIDAYAKAALVAKEIGCDGVEIHGAHGYLIDEFLWEETNKRDDSYGGNMESRLSFAREIIEECRNRVGADFPIFFRFSQWKLQNYKARHFQTPDELASFLKILSDAGVDMFDCSTRRFWQPEFDGSDLNLAGWTQKLSGQPTMTVGSVGLDTDGTTNMYHGVATSGVARLDELERMLTRGDFDLVGIGRALISDPEWVEKIRTDQHGALKGFDMADLQAPELI